MQDDKYKKVKLALYGVHSPVAELGPGSWSCATIKCPAQNGKDCKSHKWELIISTFVQSVLLKTFISEIFIFQFVIITNPELSKVIVLIGQNLLTIYAFIYELDKHLMSS